MQREGDTINAETIDKVLCKVLTKLENYVDTVDPEKLNLQSLKHVTATLKDIRELTDAPQSDGRICVVFDHPEWNA